MPARHSDAECAPEEPPVRHAPPTEPEPTGVADPDRRGGAISSDPQTSDGYEPL